MISFGPFRSRVVPDAAVHGPDAPLSLALYTRAIAEVSLERDLGGRQVGAALVLARYGHTLQSWPEVKRYWTPRVNDRCDPAAQRFRNLLDQEAVRLIGPRLDVPVTVAPPADPAEPVEAARPRSSGVLGWFRAMLRD